MNHVEVPTSLAKKLSFWGWFVMAPHTASTMAHVIPWSGAAANVEGLEPFPTTQGDPGAQIYHRIYPSIQQKSADLKLRIGISFA